MQALHVVQANFGGQQRRDEGPANSVGAGQRIEPAQQQALNVRHAVAVVGGLVGQSVAGHVGAFVGSMLMSHGRPGALRTRPRAAA